MSKALAKFKRNKKADAYEKAAEVSEKHNDDGMTSHLLVDISLILCINSCWRGFRINIRKQVTGRHLRKESQVVFRQSFEPGAVV